MTDGTQPNPPRVDVTPDGTPVELFQLVLTHAEACVLHQFFAAGARATKTDPASITQNVLAHMHVVLKHPGDYDALVKKLGVLVDWHNAISDRTEKDEA